MGSQLTLQVLARHHPRLHMHSVAALSSHPVSRLRHPSVTASSQRRLWQAIILACPHGQGFSCRVLRSSWSGRGLLPSSHDRSWMDGHHPHPWRHGLLPASHVRSWPAIISPPGVLVVSSSWADRGLPSSHGGSGRGQPSSSSLASRPPPSISRQEEFSSSHIRRQIVASSRRLMAGRDRP